MIGDLPHGLDVFEALKAGGMQGRSNEGHPGNRMRFCLDARRQQASSRKLLGEVVKNCGNLGEWAAVDHKGWHLAFRVERPIGRRVLLPFGQRQWPALEWHAD